VLTTDEIAGYRRDLYDFSTTAYAEKALVFPKIFKVVPSVKAGGNKATQKLEAEELDEHTTEDQDIKFLSPKQGWTYLIKYKRFSKGVNFSVDAIDDDTKSAVKNRIKSYADSWGAALRRKKEQFCADFFNYGGKTSGNSMFDGSWGDETDSSGNLTYDGYPWFNLTGNARSSKGGGTYYNAVVTGSLNPANFETLWVLMTATNAYTELDETMENEADTLLVESGSDYLMGRRIVETSRGVPGLQLNDLNPYEGLTKVVSWANLSGGAFYVGKVQHNGLQYQDRQKAETRFWRREENLGYRASINARFGVWLRDFRQWTRMGGSYSAT